MDGVSTPKSGGVWALHTGEDTRYAEHENVPWHTTRQLPHGSSGSKPQACTHTAHLSQTISTNRSLP